MAGLRLLRLAWHVLMMAITVALLFPHLAPHKKALRVTRWSAQMLRVLGVTLTIRGRVPHLQGAGALIVANHISWLDIHLLHSIVPCRFIAKAEIATWPVFGWLAQKTGTLFMERGRRLAAREMNTHMTQLLNEGACLALFPEGTTTAGDTVLPFRASLLEPVIQAGARLCPVSIRYRNLTGQRTTAPAYYGEMTLMESFWQVARAAPFVAEVHFLPSESGALGDRRTLGSWSETVIRADLDLDVAVKKTSSERHSSVIFVT